MASTTLNRRNLVELLTAHRPILAERYGVTQLKLFGSFARDAARPDSDVDLLVAFQGPASADVYFGTQFYLEDLLGRSIDLVTEQALRPRLQRFIEREAILIE